MSQHQFQQQQQPPQPKTQRRSHRKSRNGCAECKRRHIRCDERRPACANCTIAERTCVFPAAKEKPPARKKVSPSHSPVTHTQSPQTQTHGNYTEYQSPAATTPWSSSGGRTPNEMPPPPMYSHATTSAESSPLPSFGDSFPHPYDISSSDASFFTAEHLSLLYHLVMSKEDFFLTRGRNVSILDIAIRLSSSHPYLIDEVLALSALHKAATSCSESPHHLLRTATELQTRAITRFTRLTSTLPPEDMDSSIPRFLFAAILSLHDLADTLSSVRTLHHSQFHVFVNRFVDCFRIHHGVRAVIKPVWQHLVNSELEPILTLTSKAGLNLTPDSKGACERGDECRPLYDLLDSSDLGPATVSACRGAVERLQWSFDIYKNLPQSCAGPHAASSFSVTVGSDYIDVLRRLQPEAVIVLAYYGVLLHYCREYWIFGDAGALIVRAVAQHLGHYWEDTMAWPLKMVEDG